MGGNESRLRVSNNLASIKDLKWFQENMFFSFLTHSSLKEQAWCSNSTFSCRNCVTEVENSANTEVKRTSPIPKTELQQIMKDQKQQLRYQGTNSQKNNKTSASANVQNTQMSTYHTNSNFQYAGNDMKLVAQANQDRQRLLKELVDQVPKLELKVLSSAFLDKGEVIYINPLGLENKKSLRAAEDGFTYFGCKKSIKKQLKQNARMGATGTSNEEMNDSKSQSFEKEVVNDFVIPTKNEEEKEKHRGRQFQIYFDTDSRKYKIKDLGVGYGAFVKLTRSIVLRDNFLLNMGESYIVANLFKPQEELRGVVAQNKVPMKLRLKIFSVVKADQPEVFCFQNEMQEIIIGRTPNCDIRIEDKLLSKAQATIKCEDDQWVLTDGHEGRESTNGTWLYLNEDCEIENGMVFKSNQTFFEAALV